MNRDLYVRQPKCCIFVYSGRVHTHTHTRTHADMVEREAIKNTEENGIVFIDEIDKIIDVHRSGTFSLQVLNIIM
jgi:ATP-dependent protease HslVU (ClpYQ) ATPase subunit